MKYVCLIVAEIFEFYLIELKNYIGTKKLKRKFYLQWYVIVQQVHVFERMCIVAKTVEITYKILKLDDIDQKD